MLILQAMGQFPKYKQDVCKTIAFVSNVDVQAFITLTISDILMRYCFLLCNL